MAIRWEAKRPNEVRDYLVNWVPYLDGDTIATSAFTVSGVTKDSQANTATTATVWLSGGVDGALARVTNTITTAGGRTETETFVLPISVGEPVSLAEAKAYLRVTHTDEDAKIAAMIPAARKWVEDHTGLALVRREFVERHSPDNGAIRLFKGPLVSIGGVDYIDSAGAAATYVPRSYPPSRKIIAAAGEAWPGLQAGEEFEVAYTAGFAEGEADERLIAAMLALIEGEYAEGYAYPPRAVEAAERCCAQLRQLFV